MRGAAVHVWSNPKRRSWEKERKGDFKHRREEGRESCVQRLLPIWELKPLELWCPANLTDEATSQISMFSRSFSLYSLPLPSYCPSPAVCPSPSAFFFSVTSSCTVLCKISKQCAILLSQHIYDLGPFQGSFALCGASVTWMRALSIAFLG